MNRRDFIQTATLASGCLLIPFFIPTKQKGSLPASLAPNALLRIDPDDTVNIILNKVEMGQGIWTTLPMLIAEELDCDWARIRVEHRVISGPNLEGSVYVLSTGGSDTVRSEFDRYRMTGAIARTMLVQAAARRLGISPDHCTTGGGFVQAGHTRFSYGSLAADAAKLPIPEPVLREPGNWKIIGRSPQRIDVPDKVNGKMRYGIDIRFPGLLVAVLERCPVFGGKVKSYDASDAMRIAGVKQVVSVPAGVAIIASHTWAALQARKVLHVEWDLENNRLTDSTALIAAYREKTAQPGISGQARGDVASSWQHAAAVMEREYEFPFLAHAPMETLNCTVKLSADHCEIWTATQSPSLHRQEAARYLGFRDEQVTLHTPAMGGSFGRRGSLSNDWVLEAVQIARASGEAIKLMWTREDDIRGGFYRPLYLHQVKIGIGTDGLPTVWKHDVTGQSLFANTILENDIAPNGLDYSSLDGVNGSPYMAHCAHYAVTLHTTTTPVPVLPLRSVGNTHTAFVMETLADELAHRAGMDPVAYRKALLQKHPRHLAALTAAADRAGWHEPLPPGRFRGVAVHGAMGSVVAQVVEISVDGEDITVHRVVCAVACGLAVNPAGIVAQMESGIIYGLTAALFGEITIQDGRIRQSNFHDYRILRMPEAPLIEVHILEDEGKMGGIGEPGVAPVAPALANALFAATGKRIRKLPVITNNS